MRIDTVPFNGPVTVGPADSVLDAAVLMRDHRIGSVVVVDGDRLVGMLTDRDVALAVLCAGFDAAATQVRELVHGAPVSVLPTATVAAAAHEMRRAKVRHLPVVSPKGALFGIVAHDDLLERLAARIHRIGQAVHRQISNGDVTGKER